MNKTCLVLLVTVVFCVMESSGTVTEFFNNMPGEVSGAVTTAWRNMVAAIRKPVRIKRLGRGGKKRKSTTKSTTKTTTTEAAITQSTHVMLVKLHLPVLPTPRWQSLDEWNNQQRPRFALKTNGQSPPRIVLDETYSAAFIS